MKISNGVKIIYEDENVLVIDKPAGVIVFSEGNPPTGGERTLIELLLEKFSYLKDVGNSPRYGIVHRLDKDTSGILLVAKNDKSLEFLQKQFKDRKVLKKYNALVIGNLKQSQGKIEALIGRAQKDKRKQKVYLPREPKTGGKRRAITEYKTLKNFKNYALIEATPKTGRKHQIRCHLAYLGHPIAGDKLYGFKNQPCPKDLKRQFLHASYLKIKLPDGKIKEFKSELLKDLKKSLENLNYDNET